MVTASNRLALRGATLSFKDNPFIVGDQTALRYEADGLVLIEDGKVAACGAYNNLKDQISSHTLTRYHDALIMPGFIDTHVHYSQTQVMASYGKQLIDWLNDYTFIAEQRFADRDHARAVSDVFLQELLRRGTTTASVYCTTHPVSVDEFFKAAGKRNLRMIAGKVLMDRNAPHGLTDTVETGYDDSEALIGKWHGQGRLAYAITPRFAPTSTPAQLEAAGALWQKHSSAFMQTHISESHAEIAWVKELFPERKNYLDVYAHHGLVGPRAIFGHAIHLEESEWQLLASSGSAVAHCPTSNGFLGSGLFNFARATQPPSNVRVGLATDVGGGTSLSMLQTMNEAYKIAQFGHYSLSAPKAFYLATRGAAQALYLDDKIGSIAPGLDADLLVLDLKSTPLIDFRMQRCDNITEALFIQMMMADDRATQAVYVAGELAYCNPSI